jgi:hypothetical protein
MRPPVIPHRTITHWPWWYVRCAARILVVFKASPFALLGLGLALGSLVHLLCDSVSPHGIPWVTPFQAFEAAPDDLFDASSERIEALYCRWSFVGALGMLHGWAALNAYGAGRVCAHQLISLTGASGCRESRRASRSAVAFSLGFGSFRWPHAAPRGSNDRACLGFLARRRDWRGCAQRMAVAIWFGHCVVAVLSRSRYWCGRVFDGRCAARESFALVGKFHRDFAYGDHVPAWSLSE